MTFTIFCTTWPAATREPTLQPELVPENPVLHFLSPENHSGASARMCWHSDLKTASTFELLTFYQHT